MLDRNAEALAEFEAALRIAPRNFRGLNYRGVALARLERYADTLAAYDTALSLRADDAEIWNNRATALSKLDRYQEAIAICERALQLRPRFADELVTPRARFRASAALRRSRCRLRRRTCD